MKGLYDISKCVFLRCLRDLEKWSCFEKMRKNGQKWAKIGKNGCSRIPNYTLLTKSDSAIFPNSRASNSGCSDSICPIIKFVRDFMGIYIVAKFGTDWSIFADARV